MAGMYSPRFSGRQFVAWTVVLTVLVEAVTAALRFGFDLQSTRDTASTIGTITGGLRIHHGYVGVLIILIILAATPLWRRWPRLSRFALIVGTALLLSDLVHHFLVLWPITGSPEFHLFYPAGPGNG